MPRRHSKTLTPPAALHRTLARQILCLLLILFQTIAHAALAQGTALEQEVKATFLYKFGNYIDWPEGTFERADEPLTIGVIGAAEVAADLQQIARDKTIQGRTIIVRTFQPSEPLDEAQILFIGQSEQGNLDAVLSSTRGKPIVTVTEVADRAPGGGIINFVIDQNKVRFDIALDNADRSNIKISARLLGVARRVITRSAS
jgi:hypothetical protein